MRGAEEEGSGGGDRLSWSGPASLIPPHAALWALGCSQIQGPQVKGTFRALPVLGPFLRSSPGPGPAPLVHPLGDGPGERPVPSWVCKPALTRGVGVGKADERTNSGPSEAFSPYTQRGHVSLPARQTPLVNLPHLTRLVPRPWGDCH